LSASSPTINSFRGNNTKETKFDKINKKTAGESMTHSYFKVIDFFTNLRGVLRSTNNCWKLVDWREVFSESESYELWTRNWWFAVGKLKNKPTSLPKSQTTTVRPCSSIIQLQLKRREWKRKVDACGDGMKWIEK
jgi:hypothetical protein